MNKKLAKSLIFSLTAQIAVGFSTQANALETKQFRACEVAREFMRLEDDHEYDRIAEIWAEDAVFYSPRGDIIRGNLAIGEFFAKFLRQITPVNRIASLIWDPTTKVCVMELETKVVKGADGRWTPDARGDFRPVAIDRFVVNDAGKIAEMRVHLAAPKGWQED